MPTNIQGADQIPCYKCSCKPQAVKRTAKRDRRGRGEEAVLPFWVGAMRGWVGEQILSTHRPRSPGLRGLAEQMV